MEINVSDYDGHIGFDFSKLNCALLVFFLFVLKEQRHRIQSSDSVHKPNYSKMSHLFETFHPNRKHKFACLEQGQGQKLPFRGAVALKKRIWVRAALISHLPLSCRPFAAWRFQRSHFLSGLLGPHVHIMTSSQPRGGSGGTFPTCPMSRLNLQTISPSECTRSKATRPSPTSGLPGVHREDGSRPRERPESHQRNRLGRK